MWQEFRNEGEVSDAPSRVVEPTDVSTVYRMVFSVHSLGGIADTKDQYNITLNSIIAGNYEKIRFSHPVDNTTPTSLDSYVDSTSKLRWKIPENRTVTSRAFFGPKLAIVYESSIGDPAVLDALYTGIAYPSTIDVHIPGDTGDSAYINSETLCQTSSLGATPTYIGNLYDDYSVVTVKILFRWRSGSSTNPLTPLIVFSGGSGYDGMGFSNTYPEFFVIRQGQIRSLPVYLDYDYRYILTATFTVGSIAVMLEGGSQGTQSATYTAPKYISGGMQPGTVTNLWVGSGCEFSDILINATV